jgi:acetoin utilization deacetylase AcuC-like enzyme
MSTAYLTHSLCEEHKLGDDHPESPQRLEAIQNRLIAGQLMDFLRWREANEVTIEQLNATHDPDYVASIFAKSPEEGHIELDQETLMMPNTLDAALRASGAVAQAVDMIMSGEVQNAFCAVRPPGHHAEYGKAMGFCLFNNIAVGARHAINQYGIERIAIVDFDVHHGNGTEDIFKNDPKVLYASSYQHPLFPYPDPGASHDNIVHMPLEKGSKGEDFRAAYESELFPALEAFKPQLLMISAGFDALAEDPMGQLRLREDDIVWVTDKLMDVAERYCHGRVVSVLEGGYNTDALGRAVFSHLKAIMKI